MRMRPIPCRNLIICDKDNLFSLIQEDDVYGKAHADRMKAWVTGPVKLEQHSP